MLRFGAALRLPAPWRAARAAEHVKSEHSTLSGRATTPSGSDFLRCPLPLLLNHTSFNTLLKASPQYHCVISCILPVWHDYINNATLSAFERCFLRDKSSCIMNSCWLMNGSQVLDCSISWKPRLFLRVDDLSFAISSFPRASWKDKIHIETCLF